MGFQPPALVLLHLIGINFLLYRPDLVKPMSVHTETHDMI